MISSQTKPYKYINKTDYNETKAKQQVRGSRKRIRVTRSDDVQSVRVIGVLNVWSGEGTSWTTVRGKREQSRQEGSGKSLSYC